MIDRVSDIEFTKKVISPKRTGYLENNLIYWWKQLNPGDTIKTIDGEWMYILDKGKVNPHDGPDIKHVSLLSKDSVLYGDVEFHLKELDWFHHGHHNNPRYNNVILHVVSVSGRNRAGTSSGRFIPLIVVPYPLIPVEISKNCRLHDQISHKQLISMIKPLIYYKWYMKIVQISNLITASGNLRDAFYQQTFRALGFKGNEEVFMRLAERIPLKSIEKAEEKVLLYKIYFEKAGMLDKIPSKVGDRIKFKSQSKNQVRLRTSQNSFINSWEWNRKGIRPAAYPEQRLSFGVEVVWALIRGWQPWNSFGEINYLSLRARFENHPPGRGWCCEWMGNVIYPFAETVILGKKGLNTSEYFHLWRKLKVGYIYGKIEKQFSKSISKSSLKYFSVQQGLLALQARYCNSDLCGVCPLS